MGTAERHYGSSGDDSVLTELNQLRSAVKLLAAKLDADVGVTDTDYEAEFDTNAGPGLTRQGGVPGELTVTRAAETAPDPL